MMRSHVWLKITVLSFSLLLGSCTSNEPIIDQPYLAQLQEFKTELKEERETTWLALRGFYLLEEGIQLVGSDLESDVVFPEDMPTRIFSTRFSGDSIIIMPNPESNIILGDSILRRSLGISLSDSISKYVFSWNKYEWWFRRMGDQAGIRLRTKVKQSLENTDYYEPSPEWIKEATFIPAEGEKYIPIQNSVGATIELRVMGTATFSHKGQEYSLDLFHDSDEGNKYFLIVADETNGESTYGAGRYAYYAPAKEGKIILDFNYLYSPPCAFTEFATCPFPPEQNQLNIAIKAGEKVF